MIKRSYALTATTSLQTIYTVPEGARTEWTLLWVSNISGSNASVTVTYYNASQALRLFCCLIITQFQVKPFLKLVETITSF
jgi:hypothetical protein